MSSTYDRSPWRNSTFVLPSNPKSPSAHRPHYRNVARRIQEAEVKQPLSPDRDLMEGLKEDVVSKVAVPTVEDDDEDVSVKDCQFIGSYSWTNRDSPTIIVPGEYWYLSSTNKFLPLFKGLPRNGKAVLLPITSSPIEAFSLSTRMAIACQNHPYFPL